MPGPVVVVVGAGPGIGAAVARRFGSAGYAVALVARSESRLEALGRQLQADGVTAGWTAVDIADADALARAVERFGGFSGSLQHLHYNPSAFTEADVLRLSPAQLLADLHVGAAGLLTVVQAARPFLSTGARITATGGASADRPWPAAASLGVQKAALRNLVTAVDLSLRGEGIRAASLTVAGTVAAGTPFDPSHVADAVFDLAARGDDAWTPEVRFEGRREG